MKFWAVGASHEGNDVSKEFLSEGIWFDGYAEAGDIRNQDLLNEVQIGDFLLMKSSFTKGPNHSITCTQLKGIGKIVNKKDYYSYVVEWYDDKDLPKDFNGISYRKTIENVREDEMLNYAKQLIVKKKAQ